MSERPGEPRSAWRLSVGVCGVFRCGFDDDERFVGNDRLHIADWDIHDPAAQATPADGQPVRAIDAATEHYVLDDPKPAATGFLDIESGAVS